MFNTFGTCNVCGSTCAPLENGICQSCTVILANAMKLARRTRENGGNMASGYPQWEVNEASDAVASFAQVTVQAVTLYSPEGA